MKKYIKNSGSLVCILGVGIFFSTERKANAQTTYNYTGSLQTWTVPCGVSSITINSYGAQGGESGGDGAEVKGTFTVEPGEVLDILVGGQGLNGGCGSGGGGGGSFVWNHANDTLLIVAAGGGGYSTNGGSPPGSGSGTRITTVGGGSGSGAGGTGGTGGVYGANTGHGADGVGGGGTGWLTNGGTNPGNYTEGEGGGGFTPLSGGAAGVGGFYDGANGGYGGGGGCSGCSGASGGGGGYNGGGGGNAWSGSQWGSGGGGGSYNSGSNQTNTSGVRTGNGQIIISQNSVVSITTDTGIVVKQVSCNGGSDGSAYVMVNGSAPATTTYSWSPGGQTTDSINGLSAGTYTVNVTGYCGSATASVTITQPNAMTATGNVIANVSCYESNNGMASSNSSGGTAPFTYSWTSGATNDTATGLSAGIYRVTIMDKNGCSASTTVTITQPNVLSLATNVVSNVVCGISGSVTSSVGGGMAPYTYLWTGGGTDTSISVSSGGAYMLKLTDNNGCSVSSSVNITETPPVFISAGTTSEISCNGDNIGSISSIVSDGVAPYTYLWSNGITTYGAVGLSAGTYTVNVTDANGCSSSAEATVTEPAPLSVVTDSTVDEGGCTGSAWVIVSGGVSPYLYEWSNGNTGDFDYGLCKGAYCCAITDANGCAKYVCINVESVATGIDNVTDNAGQIMIYPNPNNGQFTIETSNVVGQSIVEVFNVLGEKVYVSNLNTGKGDNTSINISNQPNGVYLYRVLTKTGDLTGEGKIILEK